MNTIINFKDFIIVIFEYQIFTCLWNFVNLDENLYQNLLMSYVTMNAT